MRRSPPSVNAPSGTAVPSVLELLGVARPKAELEAHSPAKSRPMSGLIPVEISVSAREPATGRLKAWIGGEPALEVPVTLGPTPIHMRLAVHGHLLENGPADLRLELMDARGRRFGEKHLKLRVRNVGDLARRVAESLRRRNVPVVVEGPLDSGLYDYDDPALTAWFDREPAAVEAHLADLAARGAATAEEIEALRHFAERGFLVLPDAIDPAHLERLDAALTDAVEKGVEGYRWGESQRLHNLHDRYPAIRDLWMHPKILRMLDLIFEAPANPCQSLSYVFGSEQEHHQDTIHLTPFPAGRMCGVWTAVEDVQPDSGELAVFPGSHRAPRIYMKDTEVPKVTDEDWAEFGRKVVPLWTDLIERGGYGREVYRPKAGTVLIWHENLMHAGSPRLDRSKSRKSIVGHYFAGGAVVYYDSSGAPGTVIEREAG